MAGLKEVSELIAKEHGTTVSAAKLLITDTLDTIAKLAENESVRIHKHTFKTVKRKARTCRNPKTGEPVEVPARKVLTYKYLTAKTKAVAPPPEPAPQKKIKK